MAIRGTQISDTTLWGNRSRGKADFFTSAIRMGSPGQGHGAGRPLSKSNRFEGSRRLLKTERGDGLEQPPLFILKTEDAAVGLKDFGAGQRNPVQELIQFQGGGDGHPDAVKGAQFGDPPLGLKGELAAADRPGDLEANDREQKLLVRRQGARFLPGQHQDAIEKNVVGNGKGGEKRKGRERTGGRPVQAGLGCSSVTNGIFFSTQSRKGALATSRVMPAAPEFGMIDIGIFKLETVPALCPKKDRHKRERRRSEPKPPTRLASRRSVSTGEVEISIILERISAAS